MSISALAILTTVNDLSMAISTLVPVAHSMLSTGQKEMTLEDFSTSLGDLGSKIQILEQVIATEAARKPKV
jgi:hypothetical protein